MIPSHFTLGRLSDPVVWNALYKHQPDARQATRCDVVLKPTLRGDVRSRDVSETEGPGPKDSPSDGVVRTSQEPAEANSLNADGNRIRL